jgi:16S rRNA (cytosine1402-N4)-methyltransferase
MMAGHGEENAGGGPARHIPVMLNEVLAALKPAPGEVVIDGTFGAGGYSRAILNTGANVIAIDRDPDAISAGRAMVQEFDPRLRLVHGPFGGLDQVSDNLADGIVLDIGVSSMQLDEAERGFSFRADGPLDMRMAQDGPSAADIVNRFKVGDLIRILGILGEERHASRVARMIEKRRAVKPFVSTRDLADAIEGVLGNNPKEKIHPATRSFQGLRIFVNDELGQLAQALFAAERALKPGGRLVVVTFHSLEDRIVKRFITDRASRASGSRHLPAAHEKEPTFLKAGGVIAASEEESGVNPRARSAKLRAAVRTDAPARAENIEIFGLPALPSASAAGER